MVKSTCLDILRTILANRKWTFSVRSSSVQNCGEAGKLVQLGPVWKWRFPRRQTDRHGILVLWNRLPDTLENSSQVGESNKVKGIKTENPCSFFFLLLKETIKNFYLKLDKIWATLLSPCL